MKKKKWAAFGILALLYACIPSFSAFSGDNLFGLSLNVGAAGFFNKEYTPGSAEEKYDLYQSIGLSPEINIGKFWMAIDLNVRYRFDGKDDRDEFEVRKEDWRADNKWEFINVYFPKIRFAQYGKKGDSFSMRLGDIDKMTLGNGFIVSSYSNMLFQPESRILGAVFDIEGSIVDIPYFGIQFFTSNAARFDFMAGRIHAFPLAGFTKSILKDLEIGGTFTVDQDPYYFAERYDMYTSVLHVLKPDDTLQRMYGMDLKVPLINNPFFSFAALGDWAAYRGNYGYMAGASGRLSVFIWEGQYRILDKGFYPSYYDESYDLYRAERYIIYDAAVNGTYFSKSCKAYLASLGLSLFNDKIVFKMTSEGPMGPHDGRLFDWQGILELKEGFIPFFSFDILYSKKNMATVDDYANWKQDSLIRARFHCDAGPATLSLVYILRYIPTDAGSDRQVLTGIEGRIRLY